MPEPVILERDGPVARLSFNRPGQLNAIDVATAQALLAHCEALARDATVRAVVLEGRGKAFGVGGDIGPMQADAQAALPPLIDAVHGAVRLLTALDAPVIARLHGVVAGGSLSLALACDFAIAQEGTRFNLAYANIGASCDGSSSWMLPRLVGLRKALEIALLGEGFNAAQALNLGLVNRVVPAESLDAAVDELAHRLAAGPTLALGRIKRLMRASMDNPLSEQLDLERDAFIANAASEDFQQGVQAFLRKERPRFIGR